MRKFHFVALLALLLFFSTARNSSAADAPNIVFIMGDDWSWPHASVLGDPVVKTPNFDRIAREGVLFENAFVSSPSCTPSRHAVSSGQYHWRLGGGMDLGGSIAADVPVYPDLLAETGYQTGYCRKGTAPSKLEHRGNDPFGERYKNFGEFFEKHGEGGPFCFWYGAGEPHRPYEWESGKKSGLDLSKIHVPPFLPDNSTTRTDLGDYYQRVEKLDLFAGQILEILEQSGELENTVVIMAGDNGMPFPRAKATLYDSGTRVPLAIRWGKMIPGGRRISDFVSLTDLAPTILEATRLPIPEQMTGQSLVPTLLSEKNGTIDPNRDHVLTGMERHVYPYPSRAIRTAEHLYIRKFGPKSWPTGRTKGQPPVYDFQKTPWPTEAGAFSHNIDPGPAKQWMLHNDSPENEGSFGRHPAEELYALATDPDQLTNLLSGTPVSKETEKVRKKLSNQLTRELRSSGDPRFAEPGHSTFEIREWTIHLNDQLWEENPDITRRMLELLDGQLSRVVDVVPGKALEKLRRVPIWINPPYPGARPAAEYHPNGKWLRENSRNPKMAKCVEITNTQNFPFENRRMPYLMLHELAHAYHDRFLDQGYGNKEIRTAYKRANDSGTYEEVARFDGNRNVTDKAYGMSNPMEYFAESSEAYFGKNDFFPFNRKELEAHDRPMFHLVKELWEKK